MITSWCHGVVESSALNSSPMPPERPLPVSNEAPPTPTTVVIPKILPSVEVVRNSRASRKSRDEYQEVDTPMPRWEGISAMHDHAGDISSWTKKPDQLLESKPATVVIPTAPVILPSHDIVSAHRARAKGLAVVEPPFPIWTGISTMFTDKESSPTLEPRRAGPEAAEAVKEQVKSIDSRNQAPKPMRKVAMEARDPPQPRAWLGLSSETGSNVFNCMPSPSPPQRRSRGLSRDDETVAKENMAVETADECYLGDLKPLPVELGLADLSPLPLYL